MPPNKAKPPWGIQTFLNDPHHEDKGWIKGTVNPPASWSSAGKPSIYLHVADCDRKISLDFTPCSDAEVEERIAKVERLRDTVNAFSREALKALRAARNSEEKKKKEVKV